MFIHGARAVLLRVKYDTERLGPWARPLELRAPRNKVIVAVANKLARIAWAVLAKGQDYRAAAVAQQRNRQQSLSHSRESAEERTRRKNSQTACRRTCSQNRSIVTVGVIRTSTRGSSSWPGEPSPTKGRVHLRRLYLVQQSPLQSGGGPYIVGDCSHEVLRHAT